MKNIDNETFIIHKKRSCLRIDIYRDKYFNYFVIFIFFENIASSQIKKPCINYVKIFMFFK